MTTTTMDARPSDEILKLLRPTSRGKTSYASMNEWRYKPGQMVPPSKPVYRSMNDWKPLPTRELASKAAVQSAQRELKPSDADPPYQSEEAFQKSYDHLTNQIAYRWPNPGVPRPREGGIGGTWRHIKEVLCHGGSRTVFVDGLVSVYDSQKFTEKLQAHSTGRPHLRPMYKPIPSVGKMTTTHRESFNPYPVLPDVGSNRNKPTQERQL